MFGRVIRCRVTCMVDAGGRGKEMSRSSMSAGWPARWMVAARAHGLSSLTAMASIASLSGCAVEWTNLEPAREVAAQSEPFGSVYTGWRVFQDRCAACHGASADGTSAGPTCCPRFAKWARVAS